MKKEKHVDWIIHLVANGTHCDVCGESEDYFIQYTCNAHTHGMNNYNHPEFQMVLNVPPELLGHILNTLGLRVKNGEKFKAGDFVHEVIEDYPIRLDEQIVEGEKLLRVCIPDPNGKFPGESGCDDIYALQGFPMEMLYLEKQTH